MSGLYLSNEYYVSVPAALQENDGSYWGLKKDPDGVLRDRSNEKDRFLEDVNYILEYIDHLSPGTVLDIGCGPGWLLSKMSNKWSKYGSELDTDAIRMVNDNSIEITNQDIRDRKYPSSSFDLVIMHHVIEHLYDPISMIEEVRHILKENGILILGTPDFDSGCAKLFKSNYRMLHDPTHVSLFSCDSMHRFLRDYGFKITHVEYPFFQTRFFTVENLLRLKDTTVISPPFYGNFMTFFAHKLST